MMELQLGLALLPTNPLDLNSRAYDEPNTPLYFPSPFNRKRTFSQIFDHASAQDDDENDKNVTIPTLPLLPLTPNHDEDDDDRRSNCSTTIIAKSDENDVEAGPVGWPPVNSWRKKLGYRDQDDDDAGNDQMVWILHHHDGRHGSVGPRGSNNTLYVKVKMEGVGIARKVDLSMHHSFETLKDTLLDMFGKCHQFSKCYELAYQDEEGDWLLAEDVPWRSFIQCAQRLKLLRSSSR